MSQLKGSVKKSVPAVGADAPGGQRGKICVLRIRPGESPIGAHNAGRFVKRPYDMNRYFRLFSQPFFDAVFLAPGEATEKHGNIVNAISNFVFDNFCYHSPPPRVCQSLKRAGRHVIIYSERGAFMIPVLSVDNMRRSDAWTCEHVTPGRELMARAARSIFEAVDWRPPVAVVCGSGNNAGDGYALALLLREHGVDCTVFLLKEKFSADGRYYYEQCLARGVETRLWGGEDFTGFSTVVDCLLGTGFRGELRGELRAAIEAINRSGAYVVAADINSGLDGESGLGECCVRSDLTVSIGGYQPGHFLNMAKDVMRQKINCDIGIRPLERPCQLLERADVLPLFAARQNFANKGSYGFTALVGGSERYPGAIRLAAMANAAMRAGAGVVRVGLPRSLYHDLLPLILESTVFPLSDTDGQLRFDEAEAEALIQKCKTVAFGMGIGLGDGAAALLRWLMEHFTGTLIVDADGLTLLSRLERTDLRGAACRLVLTPHLGEFSRLTGLDRDELQRAPIAQAEACARDTGAVVLLKGPTTVVTDGSDTWLVDTGCAGMATAGSGDVLSGLLSALCAWAPEPLTAAAAAAWINGRAGELAQRRYGSITMLASDTAACIRDVVAELEQEAD